jgi:hypothetical protein
MMRVRAAAALVCVVAAIVVASIASPGALAASAAPGWLVSSVAEPSNFSSAENAKCSAEEGPAFCDRYLVTVTNVGGAPSDEAIPIRIVDTLPAGLKPVAMRGQNFENEASVGCNVTETTCEYAGSVAPGGTIGIIVEVEVLSAAGTVTNAVKVEGGGAPAVTTSAPLTLPNTVEMTPPGYGIAGFAMQVSDLEGAIDGQAADHPNDVTTMINLNTFAETRAEGRTLPENVQQPRDIVVTLPLGFIGDPLATPKCTAVQLIGNGGEETKCPPASRIGTTLLFGEGRVSGSVMPSAAGISDVYNMVPEQGYPALLGFKVRGRGVSLYASLVHTAAGYAVRVVAPGLPRTIGFEGFGLTLFGDPNVANGEPADPQAFFANPADCSSGPLTARLETDSWAAPGQWQSAQSTVYPHVGGCSLLQFAPTVEVRPEVSESESPSGLDVRIKAPQNPNNFPVLATPDLKAVTMTLPEGMTVSPGAADGLTGCEATGPNGIDMPGAPLHPDEAGEGEEIGADGMSHLSAGHCPLSSQIGTVQITTPLLADPLEGHVYLAAPQCGGGGQAACTSADATNGRLFGLYLEGEGSGVVIKLAGRVSVDPTTGRLTARFTDLPQQPVSEVSLHLMGGPRAPLANPRACGQAITSADITPWSAPVTPDALPSASFLVTWNGNLEGCPATLPFAPTLTAGSLSAAAGRFSPFTLTLQRADRSQDLSRLQVKMPAGLLGMLSSVPLCAEPQASQGTCPEASLIGSTSVTVGSGSHPFLVNGGRVYLTESYRGAPFGLSIVVPAVAGPFNLGNVIVRSAINVDQSTSAITITSDPLPQFLDGVPLRIQTLNVTVDRPGFTFNPTSCAPQQVAATVEATQGAVAHLSAPFAAEGCRNLPFKPSIKVSTQGNGTVGGGVNGKGASLDVKVTQLPGEAAIHKFDTQLPLALPARLTTLQQACTEKQFAANPASCPAGSNVGFATAITPVLNVPLTGPAYLVSHGGAAFPDLVIVLQGQGVRIDLVGNTDIKKGITFSRFDTVPDAPISSFELKLPEGRHSVLAAIKNLCAPSKTITVTKHLTRHVHGHTKHITTKVKQTVPEGLLMPTAITGQNGAVLKQNTKIAVTGCGKPTKAKRAKAKARARRTARAAEEGMGRNA